MGEYPNIILMDLSRTFQDDGSTTRILKSCLPLPLPDEVLNDVIPKAKDFALLHGKNEIDL